MAHCPTSNAPIRQGGAWVGLFDLKTISKAKIPWGLGSDIGAGPHLSMIDVMNSFVKQQKLSGLASWSSAFFDQPLPPKEFFKTATKEALYRYRQRSKFYCARWAKGQFPEKLAGRRGSSKGIFSLK